MAEKQLIHLSNAASCLSPSGSLSDLKSHLLWYCSIVGGNPILKPTDMCPKCFQVWTAGKFSLKLKSTASPGLRMQKILKKIERTPVKLSRVESSLLKRYQQNNRNKLVITCSACHNEAVMQFKKMIVEKKVTCETPVVENEVTMVSTKKKKKKDRFAGLNASAVLSATPTAPSGSLKNSVRLSNDSLTSVPAALTQPEISTPRGISCNLRGVTPVLSRTQSPVTISKKNGPKSMKQKMNSLREEVRKAEQNRVKEEFQALTIRNINVKKNNKLLGFLSKRDKDVHLEDRIHSLLQV